MTTIRAQGKMRAEAVGGVVRFAGYANRFDKPDSYGTRIDPKSVALERYNTNSVILFNHDVDKVVGKATKIEQRDDGLWVEGELSTSEQPIVAYVRDLVKEKMLKGLSIRFGEKAEYDKDPDYPGNMLIRNAELQEISIVSLPSQEQSLFSLRMVKGVLNNVHNYQEAKDAMKHVRGAKAAKYMLDCITEASSKGVERDDIMERLRDKCGMEAGDLAKALDGELTPMPEPLLAAGVEVLSCDPEKLKALNDEDAAGLETEKPADAETPADKPDEGGERQAEVSAPVKQDPPNENAMLQKLDSLVSLMGALITEVKNLREAMGPSTKEVTLEVENESESSEDTPQDPETARMVAEAFDKLEAKARAIGLI